MINGEKFFSSNLRTAQFLIVMAVTNPDVSPYKGMSMFLVPTDTPGIHVLHHLGFAALADVLAEGLKVREDPARLASCGDTNAGGAAKTIS